MGNRESGEYLKKEVEKEDEINNFEKSKGLSKNPKKDKNINKFWILTSKFNQNMEIEKKYGKLFIVN